MEQKLKKDLNRNIDDADMNYRDSFDNGQVQRLKKACGEAGDEDISGRENNLIRWRWTP